MWGIFFKVNLQFTKSINSFLIMSQKLKSLKSKVIIGYILLFMIAVISVWFVYTEILKIATPSDDISNDNKKIIQISNAIANLYASEAVGRNSILTGSINNYKEYNQLIDSVNIQIEKIKEEAEPEQLPKFDSIQSLLAKKKNSINEIILFRNNYNKHNTFEKAIGRISTTKDSLVKKSKPVEFNNKTQIRQFLNDVLTPKQLDSLSRLPVSNDSLAIAFQNVLTDLLIKENKLKYELYKKEQKLLDENRIISDQLRIILSTIEKEILQKSYIKIEQSNRAIENTTQTIAWIGAITLCLLILFAWIIIQDLTKNQNYRTQLENLNSEKEDLLRSKTMLLATVTHDIQTPLGSVIGFSDLLEKTELNKKQKQYIDNIKHSSHYILKLVNDLIDFSKLENNRIKIDQISFNFKDLIKNTCEPLEPNATNKNIELKWIIDDQLDNNYISDPYRIKQILTNLITNAIKFTQEGSVKVTAKIKSINNKDQIQIQVIDTGIGIPKSQQSLIFKEFTQAHSGIEKKFGGTGLGLTIALRILELLDGAITLESEKNKGAVFTVTIPLIQSKSKSTTIKEIRNDKEYDFLQNKKILIIDDDAMQLTLMEEIFSHYPVRIKTLIDASQAIKWLEKESFDLVLSDIQMPKIDGFELIKKIRKNPKKVISGIPVIALSGKRDLNPEDFTKKGFTSFHPKPIQLETLLELIKSILENKETIVIKNPVKLIENGKLYNLKSLNQFTQNDPESLKIIIENFITSSIQNCTILSETSSKSDLNGMSEIAHKMIPMLKQMEIYSIVQLLEPIEEMTLDYNLEEMENYIKTIVEKIEHLISELRSEIC